MTVAVTCISMLITSLSAVCSSCPGLAVLAFNAFCLLSLCLLPFAFCLGTSAVSLSCPVLSSSVLSLPYPCGHRIFIFARSALLQTRLGSLPSCSCSFSFPPSDLTTQIPAIKFTQISAQVRPDAKKDFASFLLSVARESFVFQGLAFLFFAVLLVVVVCCCCCFAGCGFFILPEIVGTGSGIMFSSLYRNFDASQLP